MNSINRMSLLGARTAVLKPSGILAAAQAARERLAAGGDLIDLADGQPDFDTPPNVIKAAIEALHRGETRYTPVDGTVALKEAVREKFRKENKLDYSLDQIIVGAGSKHLIFGAFMTSLNVGDEVIVPTPCWSSYIDITALLGGNPVPLPTTAENGFKLTPSQLANAITPRTKWLVINSPCNPTGVVYSPDELRALAAVLLDNPRVGVLSDDIYEHIVFAPASAATIAAAEPALARRTITISGVSKTYAMTGWRIGYAGGPADLIRAMTDLQSQSVTNPTSVSQAAAIEALTGSQTWRHERCSIYRERRDAVLDFLSDMDGATCLVPQGSFFIFLSCKGLLGRRTPDGRRLETDADLASYLTASAGVSTIPGQIFHQPSYLRLCFARSTEVLREACDRMKATCRRLR